jgi:hypothetical protein
MGNQPDSRSFRKIAVKSGLFVALFLSVGTVGIITLMLTPPSTNRLSIPSNLISLESQGGQKLLAESRTKQDYASLSRHFQTQKLRAYCGVASAVMVLNALKRTDKPLNQDNFFTAQTEKVRSRYTVAFLGMSLEQFANLVRSHNVNVKTRYASETTLEQFRIEVKQNLARDRDFIVVNYNRASLGQQGDGHISPIAAYHQKSDSILVEDVSSYKYPPVWVSTSQLWNAMNTRDRTTKRTRGYIIVFN